MPHVKLKNIILRTGSSKYKKTLKIKKFPYYLGLKNNDEEIYDKYVKTLPQDHQIRDTGNLSGLQKLVYDILQNGFTFNDTSIVIKHKKNEIYTCNRGRHRICILYYLYGKNCEIKLKKNTIIKIDS